MIVFFDVLVLDDKRIMRSGLQTRRDVLRRLVQKIPGRAIRSEWTLIDFGNDDGIVNLKQKFAESLAHRQEGLVLKPLHAPYFLLVSNIGHRNPGYFIKMKKDYLADMGGERDLGDFAVIGASFDAQLAPKSSIKPLHWTHFYLGCLVTRREGLTSASKNIFKVVGSVSVDKCIPKADAKWLNENGRLHEVPIQKTAASSGFSIVQTRGYGPRMTVAFKKPFVVEILGGGYEKLQNESFEMLRHPRVIKIHHDRTWEDAVTMADLERMAAEKWEVPDADKLDQHAKDVAVLVTRYRNKMCHVSQERSQMTTTQETSQQTSPTPIWRTPSSIEQATPDDAVVQETQQETWTTTSTTQCSGSTQGAGAKASKQIRMLVREDTIEKIKTLKRPKLSCTIAGLSTPPVSSPDDVTERSRKHGIDTNTISPPSAKRRRILSPLKDVDNKRNLGAYEYDSQEKTIHIYAVEGWNVQVHTK